MAKLAASFPTLKDAPGVAPFEPRALDRWASSSPAVTSGSLAAARFVLSVFNPSTAFECGRFDLHEALSVWDADHRAAFLAWATAPWWP